MDALNEANLKTVVRCLFIAAMVGVFGGTFSKVEPEVVVPMTRMIVLDGRNYEVGYDVTAKMAENGQWTDPRVAMQGQPRVEVFGYQVQGPKVDLQVPEQLKR